MVVIVARLRKDVKVLAYHKILFSKCGKRRMPSLVGKHTEDENGEKDYNTTEIYMLLLHNCLVVFENKPQQEKIWVSLTGIEPELLTLRESWGNSVQGKQANRTQCAPRVLSAGSAGCGCSASPASIPTLSGSPGLLVLAAGN